MPARPTKQPSDASENTHSGATGLGLGVTTVWGERRTWLEAFWGSVGGSRTRAGARICETDWGGDGALPCRAQVPARRTGHVCTPSRHPRQARPTVDRAFPRGTGKPRVSVKSLDF